MAKSIAVIGAGAKAAALVARAATLGKLSAKISIPDIHVFERDHAGASWSGAANFSSGFSTLCTPGEKDVGFPYSELVQRGPSRPAIAPKLFADFSWSAFLVSSGRYPDWVDRGRDHPRHNLWGKYLGWVFETAGQPIITANVTAVRPAGGRWRVEYKRQPSGSTETVVVDGVLLTGTGRPRRVPPADGVLTDRLFDAETFWPNRQTVLALEEGAVVVAGDGGSAGTIVAWLAEKFAEREVSIVSVNPLGTLFPRGDGHAERRWFSDPSEWQQLCIEDRRALLGRTEAGVISMRIKQLIDQAPNVEYRRGRATEARWVDPDLAVEIEYAGRRASPIKAAYLISAIGFDSWSLLELVDDAAVAVLNAPGNVLGRMQVERDMQPDLSLPASSGLSAGLHVPALAGLANGPGMGNLGCLGLVAKAVLQPYL